MLFLDGKSSFRIDSKIREGNLDFLYELVSRSVSNYEEKANNIDKKAGAALALMGVAAATFFFSQEFTSLEAFGQILYVFLFLIVGYFLLRALSNNSFTEMSAHEVIRRSINKDLRDIKIELLQSYYECDRENQKLLRYKKDAYNTALIIMTVLLVIVLVSLVALADTITSEINFLEIIISIIIIALITGLFDALEPHTNSDQHKRRLEKILFKD